MSTKLSVIVLSYNTKDITKTCLEKVFSSLLSAPFPTEIIVIDNASEDGSQDMILAFQKQHLSAQIQIETIFNSHNEGFPKGNNQGLRKAEGEYILFLNSDVLIDQLDWESILDVFKQSKKLGALTVRVELSSDKIDPASHRGFPTVWNSFCYYTKLEAITKNIPFLNIFFGGYHLTHFDLTKSHEIDSPSGAFYLSPKRVLDEVNGFDDTYFMYGEDLDLSFRIKEKGYKIMYFPQERVTHLKYQSGLKNTSASTKTKAHFYDSMRIFYKKHYEGKNPWFINKLVYFFIQFKSTV